MFHSMLTSLHFMFNHFFDQGEMDQFFRVLRWLRHTYQVERSHTQRHKFPLYGDSRDIFTCTRLENLVLCDIMLITIGALSTTASGIIRSSRSNWTRGLSLRLKNKTAKEVIPSFRAITADGQRDWRRFGPNLTISGERNALRWL